LPSPTADGAGLLNAAAAYNASPGVANRGLRVADGAARSLYQLLYSRPLTWKDPDYQGVNWNALTWSNLQWNATTWDNLSWDNFDWTNLAWDNLGWDNLGWDSVSWQNLGWDAGSATAPLD
ncbi:MAG TPA: hypothetical protein VF937_01265, partial [Chloroflexota bacterium]